MKSSQSVKQLFAPVNGVAVPLADLPDPAFAEGMLGDGVAIDPEGGLGNSCRFCSPCKGEVVGVTDTAHAYNLLSDDGMELLLHIGIDTVELKGRGFSPKVKAGDRVEAGDLLAEVDLAVLRESGYSTLTPLIIVGGETVEIVKKAQGRVECGKDVLLYYQPGTSK